MLHRASGALLLSLTLSACGRGGVVLIVDSNDMIAGVVSLHIHVASMGRFADHDHPFAEPRTIPPPITWGLSLPPDVSGTITLTVLAKNVDSYPFAVGVVTSEVTPGVTSDSIRVILVPGGGISADMLFEGRDLGVSWEPDLVVSADLGPD